MKKLAIAVALGVATIFGVSGCAHTQSMIHDSQKNIRNVLFSDTIVSIAKPKTAIVNHASTVIFVGNQHDYLVEGDTDLAMIFDGLDLTHLTIKIGDAELSEKGYYQGIVSFDYRKQPNTLSDKEKMILEQAGAKYFDGLEIYFIVSELKWMPIENTVAKTEYPSISASKSMIKFYTSSAKNSMGKTAMLLPFAMIGDIITAPLQIIFKGMPRG